MDDRNNDLVEELEDAQSSELLSCDKPKEANARVNAPVKQVRDADAKYENMVKTSAQTERGLCVRITYLELSLKAKKLHSASEKELCRRSCQKARCSRGSAGDREHIEVPAEGERRSASWCAREANRANNRARSIQPQTVGD